jgi:two-component system, response regulator PdtaR
MKVPRVLVVEDEPLIALLLAELLTSLGWDVCAIESCEAGAVKAATQLNPDLMIVDGQLGEECGVAAMTTILEQGFVPHFFVSGDDRRIKEMMPGSIVIQKPFFELDLARAIKGALAQTAGTLIKSSVRHQHL